MVSQSKINKKMYKTLFLELYIVVRTKQIFSADKDHVRIDEKLLNTQHQIIMIF